MSEITLAKPEPIFAKTVRGTGVVQLPTVRDLEESCALSGQYKAVLTVGPQAREVADFGHPNHRVWTFGDTTHGINAPRRDQIEEAIEWGAMQEDLLVHCHAGVSRSTATAWGVAILKGADAYDALCVLAKNHPMEEWYGDRYMLGNKKEKKIRQRPFHPNQLIVAHLEDILFFNKGELIEMTRQAGVEYFW